MNRHEWNKLEHDFESQGYSHFLNDSMSEYPDDNDRLPDGLWETPLSKVNPMLLNLIFDLHKRVIKLEESGVGLKR